jgi:hypothetical protein
MVSGNRQVNLTRKGTAMKNVPVVGLVERDEVRDLPELSEELRVALSDVAVTAREGLLAMSVGVGPAGDGRVDGG